MSAVDEILEKLKSLTLLEAAELVKQIEDTFGVSAAASAGVVMAAPGAAAAGEYIFKIRALVASAFEPLVAIGIVDLPFASVTEDLVCLSRLLEQVLCLLVTRITVGMILHRQFPVGLFDLVRRG